MSGRKYTTTTISTQELARLRKEAATAASLARSNEALIALGRQTDRAMADMERRIASQNTTISNLNTRIRNQAQTSNQQARELRERIAEAVREGDARLQAANAANARALRQAQERMSQQLSRTSEEFTQRLDRVQEETARAMDANNRRIEAAMQQTAQALLDEMGSLEDRVNTQMRSLDSRLGTVEQSIASHEQDEQTLLAMAQEYANAAQLILDDLQNNYRTELLVPGKLPEVIAAQAAAAQEIGDARRMSANAATARLVSRQALQEAAGLREAIIIAQQEWDMHYEQARQVVDAAQAQLEAARQLQLTEEADNGEVPSVDVNHWTNGDLDALSGRLSALHETLANAQGLDIDGIDAIRSAGLQASREIDDTAMFALEAFIASQDRGEIAADCTEQLYPYGLERVNDGYQGQDQRTAHRLHLRNRSTGLEIVFTQTPFIQADGTIANRLESDILSYGTLNENLGTQIENQLRAILSSMGELGFEQGEVVTAPGSEHTVSTRIGNADMEQWQQQAADTVVTPNHGVRLAQSGQ